MARAIATPTTSRTRYAAGERYFPDAMPERRYYVPAPRGLEIKIGEALERAARRARERRLRLTIAPTGRESTALAPGIAYNAGVVYRSRGSERA